MTLQKTIFKELIKNFILLFLVTTFVIYTIYIFQTFRALHGFGLDFVMEITPSTLITVMMHTTIISMVVSATMVYGRMSSDNEIDAIKTSGIHIKKLLYPAFIFGIILSTSYFILVGYYLPEAASSRKDILKKALRYILKSPPPFKDTHEIGPYLISYASANNGRLKMFHLKVRDPNSKEIQEYAAREAYVDITPQGDAKVVMLDYNMSRINERKGDKTDVNGPMYSYVLDLSSLAYDVSRPRFLKMPMLLNALKIPDKNISFSALTEIHQRISMSLYPFLLTFIASLVGILVRKSSRLAGLGASFPILIIYFISSILSQSLSENAISKNLTSDLSMNILMASYLPVLVFICLGIFLYKFIVRT